MEEEPARWAYVCQEATKHAENITLQAARDFIADLDRFLGQLPTGWPYGVEMRYVTLVIMWS